MDLASGRSGLRGVATKLHARYNKLARFHLSVPTLPTKSVLRRIYITRLGTNEVAVQVGDMVYFWTGRGSYGYAIIREFKAPWFFSIRSPTPQSALTPTPRTGFPETVVSLKIKSILRLTSGTLITN
jgi:hypothetical protein